MLSIAVNLKVRPYLLRDMADFGTQPGPPPRPWLLGFRRVGWWAAEPDHPPSTYSFGWSGSAADEHPGVESNVGTGAGRGQRFGCRRGVLGAWGMAD